MGLLEGMQAHKGLRKMTLYWDIETLAYNKIEGRKQPTNYKNVVYSVAVGWDNNGSIDVEVFSSFYRFFTTFFKYAERKDTITKSRTAIEMIAHNCNKYDNHFLLHDIQHMYSNVKIENLFMKSANTNENTVNMREAKSESKDENIVLEKRVKSSINLDLTFFLEGFKFVVVDNFMKTTASIATLGKKLKDGGYLTDDQLKTDFKYDIFDIEDDMDDIESYAYARECFNRLDKDQMTYIHNDVIILGQCHIHYSDIFPNFDYSKMTFSVNILESYMNNDLTSFQLLNQIGDIKISYTDYKFHDLNLYDYIKGFYRGGLNMYNPKYIGQIIDEPSFSIDINSSYPYVMYHEKIPTYLSSYNEYEKETVVNTDLENRDQFTLYKMTKQSFNFDILFNIESDMIKKILVKYYATSLEHDKDYVNINTNTLRMIEDLTDIDLSRIATMSYLTFDCEYFGARDIIHENYFIKTQGKLKTKIDMPTPYEYTITDEVNETVYSDEEVMLSKVILNGLYGIPALRSHFNLFRKDEDGFLYNMMNGYKNTERNIMFSTFVTSQSLYNLLEPLQDLTQEEIDDNFIYCDTDSLYLKSTIKYKINKSIYDPISLGKWDIENDHIEKMYVLNHKKYAYLKPSGKIHVASAGVPLDAFNTDQSFDDFINNDFHDGAVIYNNKSIYNKQGTISIYPSKTNIDMGSDYPTFFSDDLEKEKENMFEEIKKNYDPQDYDDILYIESHLGIFAINDLYPVINPIDESTNIKILKMSHDKMKY